MSTGKGLLFANIVDFGEWQIAIKDEAYFKDQDIRGAVEYKRDLFITCIDMDLNIYFIDRKTNSVVKAIENPSGSDRPLCLRLIPGFEGEKMPFVMLRD